MPFELAAEIVKRYLLPGSLSLLLLGVTAGLILWYLDDRRGHRVRAALTGLVAMYWLLALPWVSDLMVAGLSAGYEPLERPASVDAVVVLGGGAATYRTPSGDIATLTRSSALRALEGVRLFELLHPEWVVVSGGPGRESVLPESLPLHRALVEHGVPEDQILLESGSSDTREQALSLQPLFDARQIESFVLITSPSHIRRAELTFRNVGLEGLASPAPAESLGDPNDSATAWVPSLKGLQRSTVAAREVLALVYYWMRGWI